MLDLGVLEDAGTRREHGPHQLAQKLTMTGLPRRSARLDGAAVDGRPGQRRSGVSPPRRRPCVLAGTGRAAGGRQEER